MLRTLITALLTIITLCETASAQTWPSHPVRLIVGFGSGGPDAAARIMAQALSLQMGQQFVVDNRPGASGIIGADMVAKAAPDGYTLLSASGTFALFPSTYKALPFDVLRDFVPITQVGASDGFVLVASPALQARTVQELLAIARAPNSKVSFGSNGAGTIGHLVGAVFNAAAKTHMVHVPYKSAAATLNALLGGEIQIAFATPALSVPLVKAGKLRALAYEFPTRLPSLPEVPTLAEAGGPTTGIQAGGQFMFAPAKVPAPTLARIETEVRKAVMAPETRERLIGIGLVPVGNSSSECRALFANMVKRYGDAARIAGIQPE
jgi:tripartite-type tricarboxylate transporter receptor subunit TctC